MKKLLSLTCVCCLLVCLLIPTAYAADFLTYAPFYGYCYFSTSDGERYARITVKWNDAGIEEFDASNDTYEQELVFYNYDDTAYATTCSVYQTNIPDPYLDTQLLDDGNEANLAIGTTSADEIVADTSYYYVYNLKGSNSTASMYKVSSQEGYYIVLPSTFSTFAQSTAHLIPFKSGYTAPEARGWYTEVEPNGSTGMADVRYPSWWLSGVLSTTSDVDYIYMYLNGNQDITFISPSNTDYDVAIYNSSGTHITGLGSSLNEQTITYTFPAGYYYFKIYSFSESSTTNVYRLIVE